MSGNRTLVLYVVATGCVWQSIEREKETDKETERDRKSWDRLATKKQRHKAHIKVPQREY